MASPFATYPEPETSSLQYVLEPKSKYIRVATSQVSDATSSTLSAPVERSVFSKDAPVNSLPQLTEEELAVRLQLLQQVEAQNQQYVGGKLKFCKPERDTLALWDQLCPHLVPEPAIVHHHKLPRPVNGKPAYVVPPPFCKLKTFRKDFRKGVFECYIWVKNPGPTSVNPETGVDVHGGVCDPYIPLYIGTEKYGAPVFELLNSAGGFYKEHWDMIWPKCKPPQAVLEPHKEFPDRGLVFHQVGGSELRMFRFWSNSIIYFACMPHVRFCLGKGARALVPSSFHHAPSKSKASRTDLAPSVNLPVAQDIVNGIEPMWKPLTLTAPAESKSGRRKHISHNSQTALTTVPAPSKSSKQDSTLLTGKRTHLQLTGPPSTSLSSSSALVPYVVDTSEDPLALASVDERMWAAHKIITKRLKSHEAYRSASSLVAIMRTMQQVERQYDIQTTPDVVNNKTVRSGASSPLENRSQMISSIPVKKRPRTPTTVTSTIMATDHHQSSAHHVTNGSPKPALPTAASTNHSNRHHHSKHRPTMVKPLSDYIPSSDLDSTRPN